MLQYYCVGMDVINDIIGNALDDGHVKQGVGAYRPPTSKKGLLYHGSVVNKESARRIKTNRAMNGGSTEHNRVIYDVTAADKHVKDEAVSVRMIAEPKGTPSVQLQRKLYMEEKLREMRAQEDIRKNGDKSKDNVSLSHLSNHPKTRVVTLPAQKLKSNIDVVASIINDPDLFDSRFADEKGGGGGGASRRSPRHSRTRRNRSTSRDGDCDYKADGKMDDDDSDVSDYKRGSKGGCSAKGGPDSDDDCKQERGRIRRRRNLHSEETQSSELRKVRQRQIAANSMPVQQPLDVQRHLVEPRSVAAVAMSQQVAARARLRTKQQENIELTRVLAAKKTAESKPRVFYGPQLPVSWGGAEPAVGTKRKGSSKRKPVGATSALASAARVEMDTSSDAGSPDSGADSDDSISEGMLRWLKSRQSGEAEGQDDIAGVSDAADAYLLSSYAGAPRKNTAPSMKPRASTLTPAAKLILAMNRKAPSDEFLGPQLPVNWVANLEDKQNQHKYHSLKMDTGLGRDERKVYKKGEQQLIRFGARDKLLHLLDGPGGDIVADDDTGAFSSFGQDAGGLAFDKQVAREDQVGPRGEKPESALLSAKERTAMTEYLREEGIDLEEVVGRGKVELDLEVDRARDYAQKHGAIDNTGILYGAERYKPTKEVPEDTREPLQPFKGMVEELALKSNALYDFNKMKGRNEAGVDGDDTAVKAERAAMMEANNDMGLEFDVGIAGGAGAVLEIDATAARDKAKKVDNNALFFPLEANNPRFEKLTKAQRLELEREQNREIPEKVDLKPYKVVAVVDMSKQVGRPDADADAEMLSNELNDHADLDMALVQEKEREDKLNRAHGMQSHIKKPAFYANFDNQTETATAPTEAEHQALYGADDEVKFFQEAEEKRAPHQRVVVADFNRQRGRDEADGKIDRSAVLGPELAGAEEGRVLDIAADVTAQSQYKPTRTPNFGQQLHPARDDDAGALAQDAETFALFQEKVLELDDVDHSAFKPGGQPTKSNLIMMSKNVEPRMGGGGGVKPNKDVLGDELEELILAPNREVDSRSKRVLSHKWRESNEGGLDDLSGEAKTLLTTEQLDLVPNIDTVREKAITGAAWKRQGLGADRTADKALMRSAAQELGVEGSPRATGLEGGLDIDPNAVKDKRDKKTSLKWADAPVASSSELIALMKSGSKKGSSGDGVELEMLQNEELILADDVRAVKTGQGFAKSERGGGAGHAGAVANELLQQASKQQLKGGGSSAGLTAEDKDLLLVLDDHVNSVGRLVLDEKVVAQPAGTVGWKNQGNKASDGSEAGLELEKLGVGVDELQLSPRGVTKKVQGGGFSTATKDAEGKSKEEKPKPKKDASSGKTLSRGTSKEKLRKKSSAAKLAPGVKQISSDELDLDDFIAKESAVQSAKKPTISATAGKSTKTKQSTTRKPKEPTVAPKEERVAKKQDSVGHTKGATKPVVKAI